MGDEKKDFVIYFGTGLCDIVVICFYGYENRVTVGAAIIDLHPAILSGGGIDAGGRSYVIPEQAAQERGMGTVGSVWAIEYQLVFGALCSGHAARLARAGVFVRRY